MRFFVHTMYAMWCVHCIRRRSSSWNFCIIIIVFSFNSIYNKVNGFLFVFFSAVFIWINAKIKWNVLFIINHFALTASPSEQMARDRERARAGGRDKAKHTSLFYINKMHICFLNTTIISHFMTIDDIFVRVEVCERQRRRSRIRALPFFYVNKLHFSSFSFFFKIQMDAQIKWIMRAHLWLIHTFYCCSVWLLLLCSLSLGNTVKLMHFNRIFCRGYIVGCCWRYSFYHTDVFQRTKKSMRLTQVASKL